MTSSEHFCGNSGKCSDPDNCRNNWNRNYEFVVSVMPGSVSGVFSLNFIVFVMPVSVSEFVSHENHARHYENNKIPIKNNGNTDRNYRNNEIRIFNSNYSGNCRNAANCADFDQMIRSESLPPVLFYYCRRPYR